IHRWSVIVAILVMPQGKPSGVASGEHEDLILGSRLRACRRLRIDTSSAEIFLGVIIDRNLGLFSLFRHLDDRSGRLFRIEVKIILEVERHSYSLPFETT